MTNNLFYKCKVQKSELWLPLAQVFSFFVYLFDLLKGCETFCYLCFKVAYILGNPPNSPPPKFHILYF